ncbi:hypothetical protein CH252_11910 [Rhodococcus sp. 06-1477-1B]|nr:hypothetical protein CH252_11910 [Rhodococcus sp. 06-1477-1B]
MAALEAQYMLAAGVNAVQGRLQPLRAFICRVGWGGGSAGVAGLAERGRSAGVAGLAERGLVGWRSWTRSKRSLQV